MGGPSEKHFLIHFPELQYCYFNLKCIGLIRRGVALYRVECMYVGEGGDAFTLMEFCALLMKIKWMSAKSDKKMGYGDKILKKTCLKFVNVPKILGAYLRKY